MFTVTKFNLYPQLLIFILNSYDVIFLTPWSDILEKFNSFKANVVFAAENFCWPDEELKPKYPEVDGDVQRFLNSGMFIGYAANIWEILNSADIKDTEDDQLFYTHAFLNEKLRESNKIKLDHKSVLFQNLNGNVGKSYKAAITQAAMTIYELLFLSHSRRRFRNNQQGR